MSETVLQQGIELMLFGMGTVFVFLTLLVSATFSMSAFIDRYLAKPNEPSGGAEPVVVGNAIDPKVVRIIQAALDQHRTRD